MDSVAKFSNDGKGCGDSVSCPSGAIVRGVCPEGWHLPNRDEWESLLRSASIARNVRDTNVRALKSTSGWNSTGNGSNALGFSMLPASYRFASGAFGGIGFYADFWSSTINGSAEAYVIEWSYENHTYIEGFRKGYAVPVRCLRD